MDRDTTRGTDPKSTAVTPSWKTRLYGSYCSSGQVLRQDESTDRPEDFLSPRGLYLNHLIKRHFPQNRESRILDLGCGHGAFLYFLACAGYTSLTGVDVSQQQIDFAHRLGISQAQQGDILEFIEHRQAESADIILLMDVLEHLEPQEIFDLLDSVYRVLVPGGICLVHVPNAEGLYGMRIRYGDFTHRTAFTARSASQILNTVGFRRVEVFEDKPVAHGLKSIIRRAVWDLFTIYHRLLLIAETATTGAILSQNLLVRATK
jgi:SAM-dependent methyltransferase